MGHIKVEDLSQQPQPASVAFNFLSSANPSPPPPPPPPCASSRDKTAAGALSGMEISFVYGEGRPINPRDISIAVIYGHDT